MRKRGGVLPWDKRCSMFSDMHLAREQLDVLTLRLNTYVGFIGVSGRSQGWNSLHNTIRTKLGTYQSLHIAAWLPKSTSPRQVAPPLGTAPAPWTRMSQWWWTRGRRGHWRQPAWVRIQLCSFEHVRGIYEKERTEKSHGEDVRGWGGIYTRVHITYCRQFEPFLTWTPPKSMRNAFPPQTPPSMTMFAGFTSRCTTGGRREPRYSSVLKSSVAIRATLNH